MTEATGPAEGLCLWQQTAGPTALRPRLEESLDAEVGIVGGGVAGLSAALFLAERGCEVVLLEAGEPGEGASGRSGGQILPGFKRDPEEVERILGPAAGRRALEFAVRAPDLVFSLIERHRIRCEPRRGGWVQAATSQRQLEQLLVRAEQWRQRGVELEYLDRRSLAERLGTEGNCGGLLDRRGGTVHPVRYLRGLAAAAVGRGARIFARSEVRRIERLRDCWWLATRRGSLRCDRLLLCTNAYGRLAEPDCRRAMLILHSVQMASEPLPPALREGMLRDGVCVSDSRRLLNYYRLDPEGRFVIGGRGGASEGGVRRAVSRLRRRAARLFPALPPDFPFVWHGRVGLTENRLPQLARLAPDLFALFGFNGRGLALGTAFGEQLAALASGTPASALAYPLRPFRPWPHAALLRMLLPLWTGFAGVLDRLEERGWR